MLRLRPSELTLTPEDVEETLRRMAHRQASRGPLPVSSGAAGQPGRPLLRRGPQRAVRDAITSLGDIPILRPQAQQAIHAAVDDYAETNSHAQAPTARDRTDSVSGALSIEAGQTASTAMSALSALRIVHLPLRLAGGHRRSNTQRSLEERITGAGTALAPQSTEHITGTPSDDASSTNTFESVSPSPATPATRGSVELRGGGPSEMAHVHPTSGDATYAPSPLRQVHECSPPRNREPTRHDLDPSSSSDEEPPTRYLQGHFTDPIKHPSGRSYWFEELIPVAPQTEPRRHSGRQVVPMRSLSSGSVPAYPLPPRRANPSDSSTEDVFGATPALDLPLQSGRVPSVVGSRRASLVSYNAPLHGEPFTGRSRQFPSEASSASAFSLYELPSESRHPSSEQLGYGPSYYGQYDGTAASRHTSGGAYFSVRPSEMRPLSSSVFRPSSSTSSSQSAPNLVTAGQHGISPLPSVPYTRSRNTPAMSLTTPSTYDTTVPTNDYVDAATAVDRDLRSPLDPFAEYYQRSMRPQAARQTMAAQLTSYSDQTEDMEERYDAIDRSYTRRTNNTPQYHGRSAQGTRANQRSSENAPVGTSTHDGGHTRNNQVQVHRAAYERLQHAQQAMHEGASRLSVPQPTRPRDTSNRPRTQVMHHGFTAMDRVRRRNQQLSSSPLPPVANINLSSGEPSVQDGASGSSPGVSPRIPPRYGTRQQAGEALERAQTRTYRRPAPAAAPPPPTHLHPIRDQPSTSLALDYARATTSRLSPLVRHTTMARTHRRLTPQQRDQENSDRGGDQLMMREGAAIMSRHGQEEQRDEVMDETPPRMGRVERHI